MSWVGALRRGKGTGKSGNFSTSSKAFPMALYAELLLGERAS